VTLQTLLVLAAFYFAPKHGVIAARRKARVVKEDSLRRDRVFQDGDTVRETA